MSNHNRKYIIISPVRNEADYIENTLKSVTSQTILPIEWVIVDDGSTDNTVEIIKNYSKDNHWIKLINKNDRGYAEPGRGVMEAFYAGYQQRESKDFDFIVKLDGDLTFDSTYFEALLEKFEKNSKLGIAGGYCYIEKGTELEREDHPKFHVRGPTKVYRKECWNQIDGLVKHLGWDTIDEVKALYYGWETQSFDDIKLIHHKVTGFKSGKYRWAILLGRADFFVGYHPLFMLAKCVKRLFDEPYLIGSVGIFSGYFSHYFSKKKPIVEKDIVKFLQKEQLKSLVLRKSLWTTR